MKISIWQQFSSNHSSSFTVVGEFASREDAERAADEIRAILKMITDWDAQYEEGTDDWASNPSPPEKILATQYNVEWNRAIDWAWNVKIEIVLDRLVFMSNTRPVEAGGQPFDQIMNRLGGKGYHEGDIYGDTTGWILFDLTCTAPDDEAAILIYNQYLGINRRIKRDGTHMRFYRWRFDEHPHFTKLVENLAKHGFTEIKYSFEQFYLDRGLKLYGVDDLDVLIDILKKSDSSECGKAAAILGEIGDPRAVEPLIDALQSLDHGVRSAAASALGKINDKRAVEPLLRLLTDPNGRVRQSVVTAIGKLADERAVEPLILALKDDQLWQQAANALGMIGEPALAALREAVISDNDFRLKTALQRVQETIRGGQLLIALRSNDEVIQETAFERIQRIGDINTMLAFLRNPGSSSNYQLRERLIDVLSEFNDPRIVPTFSETSLNLEHKTISALGKIGPSAVGSLIGFANLHAESWVRERALQTLSQMGNPLARDLFVRKLQTGDVIQQRLAATGLAKIDDKWAIPLLIRTFLDKWEERYFQDAVFLKAIMDLGGKAQLVEKLIPYLQLPDWKLTNTIYLLGEIGDQRAIPPLVQLLETADERIKPTIQEALRKLGHPMT